MNFRKLDVYQLSIRFLPVAAQIERSLPRGYSSFQDQLRRASLSVPLNIAEGSGKITEPDRRRYYATARGSAMECGAIVDACEVLEFIDQEVARQARDMLTSMVRMLSKMCMNRE